MNTGHECGCCGKQLTEDEYRGTGSWSYTCSRCGFTYIHSSLKTEQEQVDDFQERQEEEDELYEENIDEDED